MLVKTQPHFLPSSFVCRLSHVNMSAVGLTLATLLCFSGTALSDPERSPVVWKKGGETLAIHCRTSETTADYLELCWGLCEKDQLIFMHSSTDKILPAFRDRVETKGAFPNVDIFIKNLTSEDSGTYSCMYKRVDENSGLLIRQPQGSVLLVVTEKETASCETNQQQLVLVAVVISAIVLFGFILGAIMWLILKTKRTAEKPRRVATNDVYEDMRATIRR